MEINVAGLTVKTVLPVIEFKLAEIVGVPAATGVASPLVPEALLMVALVTSDEAQVTEVVISWVVASL